MRIVNANVKFELTEEISEDKEVSLDIDTFVIQHKDNKNLSYNLAYHLFSLDTSYKIQKEDNISVLSVTMIDQKNPDNFFSYGIVEAIKNDKFVVEALSLWIYDNLDDKQIVCINKIKEISFTFEDDKEINITLSDSIPMLNGTYSKFINSANNKYDVEYIVDSNDIDNISNRIKDKYNYLNKSFSHISKIRINISNKR